jgi:hypothetical protein
MADEQQCRSGRCTLAHQQVHEDGLGFVVQGRRRLISKHQVRGTEERAGSRYTLLLSDAQCTRWRINNRGACKPEFCQQLPGGDIWSRACLYSPGVRKPGCQQNILKRTQPWQQVEQLKDDTDVICAKLIPYTSSQCPDISPTDFN